MSWACGSVRGDGPVATRGLASYRATIVSANSLPHLLAGEAGRPLGATLVRVMRAVGRDGLEEGASDGEQASLGDPEITELPLEGCRTDLAEV
jgi:hypothetical protein